MNAEPALQSITEAEFFSRDWRSALVRYGEADRLLFNILNFSAYFAKLSEYANVFPQESLLLVHNEDLRGHGQECMDQIFDFLDVPRITSSFFATQNYVTRTGQSELPLGAMIDFYKVFGEDYYHSYSSPQFRRVSPVSNPSSPTGAVLGDVAIGSDGWVFLTGGTNSPIEYFRNDDGRTDKLVKQWHDVVRSRQHSLGVLNIKYLHCFIPEKITIYGGKLDWPINHIDAPGYKFIVQAPDDVKQSILDIFSYFLNVKDEFPLYYKTDSHWSHIGAFVAYQLICSRLGMAPRNDLLSRPTDEGSILLDLGAKLPTPVKEHAVFPRFVQDAVLVDEGDIVKYKKARNKKDDIGLHVGSTVSYRNEAAPHKKRVLLFGDSFSEYREHLLSGMLAETFSEFMFVWSTSLDPVVVREFSPDIVLTVCTERFMGVIPDDTFDLKAYVRKTLKGIEGNSQP